MSEIVPENKLKPIQTAEIADQFVSGLGDRPNQSGAYGIGGLSPAQLKAHFDKIGNFLIEKLNYLLKAMQSGDIYKAMKFGENLNDIFEDLEKFLLAIESGVFATKLKASDSLESSNPTYKSLQTIITDIKTELKRLDTEQIADKNDLTGYKGTIAGTGGAENVGINSSIGAHLSDLVSAIDSGVLATKIMVKEVGTLDVTNTAYINAQDTLKGAITKIITTLKDINTRFIDLNSFVGERSLPIGQSTVTGTLDNHNTRISTAESKIGNMAQSNFTEQLGENTITDAVKTVKQRIDSLQHGVVPRQLRGVEPLRAAEPFNLNDIKEGKTLSQRLTERVVATTERQPNNSDAIQVIDDEFPDKGKVYTYYYWDNVANPNSGLSSGWYLAHLYMPDNVNEIPAYVRYIQPQEWSPKLSDPDNQFVAVIRNILGDYGTGNIIASSLQNMHIFVVPYGDMGLAPYFQGLTAEGHKIGVDNSIDVDFRVCEKYPRGLNYMSLYGSLPPLEALDYSELEEAFTQDMQDMYSEQFSKGYARSNNYFVAEDGTVIVYTDEIPLEQSVLMIRAGRAYYTAAETHILDIPQSQIIGLGSTLEQKLDVYNETVYENMSVQDRQAWRQKNNLGNHVIAYEGGSYAQLKSLIPLINSKADASSTLNALNGKSDAGHTHDSRYYTEDEIDAKLNDKADATATQTALNSKVKESDIIGNDATKVVKTATFCDNSDATGSINMRINAKANSSDVNTALAGKLGRTEKAADSAKADTATNAAEATIANKWRYNSSTTPNISDTMQKMVRSNRVGNTIYATTCIHTMNSLNATTWNISLWSSSDTSNETFLLNFWVKDFESSYSEMFSLVHTARPQYNTSIKRCSQYVCCARDEAFILDINHISTGVEIRTKTLSGTAYSKNYRLILVDAFKIKLPYEGGNLI